MTKYDFTLVLVGDGELSEQLAEDLFAAGCDDGTPGSCDGVVTIDFHREAESLELAIRSALDDVRTVGKQVMRVELEPTTVSQSA